MRTITENAIIVTNEIITDQEAKLKTCSCDSYKHEFDILVAMKRIMLNLGLAD